MTVLRCQAEGYHVALVNAKDYRRRHKACEMYSKAPRVVLSGREQRFCQQCSRFHVVSEFDDSKRSCRRRLAGHNERRRKSYHHSAARNSVQVTPLRLRATESEASERGTSKGGFIYCCLGHSFYFEEKSSSADWQNNTPKMPYCHGLEFLGYRPATATESKGHEHATPQPQAHEHATPQPQGNELATPQPQSDSKPGHVWGEEYLNRVRRNMSVVASAVARNLKRLGNYAKETLGDILDSNRRGPK